MNPAERFSDLGHRDAFRPQVAQEGVALGAGSGRSFGSTHREVELPGASVDRVRRDGEFLRDRSDRNSFAPQSG
ncbi:hypothetical protein, partial [Streptomyces edwardsiae]